MIVRNEIANLERCLSVIADHIDCWVIGDTGSTDGTQDFIRSFFRPPNLPGELQSFRRDSARDKLALKKLPVSISARKP